MNDFSIIEAKKGILSGILIIAFVLGAFALPEQTNSSLEHDYYDTQIPEISINKFKTIVGNYNSKEWKLINEKPVIVNFYSSWADPTSEFIEMLDNISNKYKDQIMFYNINLDHQKELLTTFDLKTIPTLICFNKDNKISYLHYPISSTDIENHIEKNIIHKYHN